MFLAPRRSLSTDLRSGTDQAASLQLWRTPGPLETRRGPAGLEDL